MKTAIVQRHDFLVEILPALVIGILLNLIGRYLCDVLQAANAPLAGDLFLDMVGTAYAAIMAGPWWAALVGTASSAVNGNFYSNYFPFNVVNVFGGLAWGY